MRSPCVLSPRSHPASAPRGLACYPRHRFPGALDTPLQGYPMSTTRRDFIKQAAMLSAAGMLGGLPDVIRRAQAIEPAKGSTFLDAKHVVVLMQENRSFDHAFGPLRGVRGFNDPRAIRLHDGVPVWAQPDSSGRRFLPHRLD